jgi:hypothetical protein
MKQLSFDARSKADLAAAKAADMARVPVPSPCWLVSQKFNLGNIAEFNTLYNSGRLKDISLCTATGRIVKLTIAEAERHMATGGNVYVDVGIPSLSIKDAEATSRACGVSQ